MKIQKKLFMAYQYTKEFSGDFSLFRMKYLSVMLSLEHHMFVVVLDMKFWLEIKC